MVIFALPLKSLYIRFPQKVEFLITPEDLKKKSKTEMLNYYSHLQKIYLNYNEEEIIEDIKKEVFPHYDYT